MTTRTKRIVLAIAGLGIVGGLAAGGPTCFGKPWKVDHAGMRILVERGLESPEMMSQFRPLDGLGLDYYSDDLDDRDYRKRVELFDTVDDYLVLVESYDTDDLDEQERLTKDALVYLLSTAAKLRPFAYHDYPLNPTFGTQSGLPDFMMNTHQIHDEGDAEEYVARVIQFDRAFAQILEGLEYREEQGVIPPRFVVEKVVAEMKGFIGTPPRENPLFVHFTEQLEELEGLEEDRKAEFEGSLEAAIVDHVVPAYQRVIDYLGTLLPQTGNEHGVWHLPDGDALYDIVLELFTTTQLDADEVHEIGLAEVAKLQGEITRILAREGVVGEMFLALMQQLEAQPRFYYPDTDEGREQILRDYATIIEEIDAGLAPLFNHRPKAEVVVKREHLFKEATAPGAHYEMPPLDGSKPGTFVANLHDIKATPKYGMRTLAYHEAVPGHHYQFALSLENEALPLFRRMLPFGAYMEGWALYAEQLAAEHGFQEDPYDRVGYLQAQLFRAVRLVVDTGIHRKRWTRERAVDYMRANTGMAESDVVAEIERYIVMPGQACSYMIGRMKIVELRDRAQMALGERFDLRGFHDALLLNGPLPLTLLERAVDAWVADQL